MKIVCKVLSKNYVIYLPLRTWPHLSVPRQLLRRHGIHIRVQQHTTVVRTSKGSKTRTRRFQLGRFWWYFVSCAYYFFLSPSLMFLFVQSAAARKFRTKKGVVHVGGGQWPRVEPKRTGLLWRVSHNRCTDDLDFETRRRKNTFWGKTSQKFQTRIQTWPVVFEQADPDRTVWGQTTGCSRISNWALLSRRVLRRRRQDASLAEVCYNGGGQFYVKSCLTYRRNLICVPVLLRLLGGTGMQCGLLYK